MTQFLLSWLYNALIILGIISIIAAIVMIIYITFVYVREDIKWHKMFKVNKRK